jgi:hypothetical protein
LVSAASFGNWSPDLADAASEAGTSSHAPARWVAAQRALAFDPMVLLREE